MSGSKGGAQGGECGWRACPQRGLRDRASQAVTLWRGLDGGAGTPPGIGRGGASCPGPDTRSPPRTCPRESETPPLGARASFPRRGPPSAVLLGRRRPLPAQLPLLPSGAVTNLSPSPTATPLRPRALGRVPVPPEPLAVSRCHADKVAVLRASVRESVRASGRRALALGAHFSAWRCDSETKGPQDQGSVQRDRGAPEPVPEGLETASPTSSPTEWGGLRRNSGNIRLTLSGLSVSRTHLPASVRPALSEPPRLRPARVRPS